MDLEVGISGHKTASSWQRVKGKCLPGKRECLGQTSKHCFWEGQFLYCSWQGWTLIQIIQRPYKKGLAYSALGRSQLGLWYLFPSNPLNWHDASLSPITDWQLGVVVFRPLWQEQTAVVLYLVEQGSNPLQKQWRQTDRPPLAEKFLEDCTAVFRGLSSGLPASQGQRWSTRTREEIIRTFT